MVECVMQRLGLNQGEYRGETIDVEAVLRSIAEAARASGWSEQRLWVSSGLELTCWNQPASGHSSAARRVYVSTGIHGDEPAGPLAIRHIFREQLWPMGIQVCLFPCLNPSGFARNRRFNAAGLDLNRDYRHRVSNEVQAHARWLDQCPYQFDAAFCLHEDWEAGGYYLYELNPDGKRSIAEPIIAAVEKVCPIETAEVIDGRPRTAHGIIRPLIDPMLRPEWPEAFFLMQRHTRMSYTLESPSDFPLETRVQAQVAGLVCGLRELTAAR